MQAGRAAAAYEWLQKQLDRPEERTSSEDETLRTAVADLYRGQARWEDLLKFTSKWIERKPEYQSAYLQHLSVLVYNDKLDAANALAQQWLKESQIEGKLAADQEARLEAAISFAQGNAYNLSFYRMDERWFEPLAEAVRFFARSKDQFRYVGRIMDYRFDGSDAADRVRGYFLKLLETELAKLSPEQINGLVGRTLSGRLELAEPLNGRKQVSASEIPDTVWKKIADQLHARWKETSAKTAADDKHQLGEALRTIYATRFDDRIAAVPPRADRGGRRRLQAVVYQQPVRDAALSPLERANRDRGVRAAPQLTDAADAGDRLMAEVPALYRLVDAMIRNRQAAAEQELHDKGEVDKLTRTQLAAKKAEIRKAARTGVAKRLAEEAAKEKGPLAPWLRIEKAYLDVGLDQNLPGVEVECWKILGEPPPKQDLDAEAAEELSPAQIREQFFDSLLQQRAFVTVMNLAARKNAKPATINPLIKYIDAGIALGGDQAAPWRTAKFQLLIALDRPDDLERELRTWIRADVSTAPWRKALAMLLAERGKFDEPISLFEAAEKDHLLTAADYRTLADWYLIAARREAYDRSRARGLQADARTAFWRTGFTAMRNRWQQTDRPLPSELDDNTLLAIRALFEKSAAPENYLWQLRELYTACRDFRLLQMLPDAALGRSPQQVYSFLQNLQGQILGEIHNESTADEIMARIKKLREGKLTATDLRALDLLEAVVERRAAEVLNQRGPHVDACSRRLKRAFDRPWGEERAADDGRLSPKLGQAARSEAHRRAASRAEGVGRKGAGRQPRSSANHQESRASCCSGRTTGTTRRCTKWRSRSAAYEQAHDGHWPFADDDVLGSYMSMLEGAKPVRRRRDAALQVLG